MSYPYFHISKKSNYAIRAMLELSLQGRSKALNVRKLAEAQDIPNRFLEVILNELKQGGFVSSVRGKAGGYLLAEDPAEITLGRLLRFLERNNDLENTSSSELPRHGDFVLRRLINDINDTIGRMCDNATLKWMAGEEMKNKDAFAANYII